MDDKTLLWLWKKKLREHKDETVWVKVDGFEHCEVVSETEPFMLGDLACIWLNAFAFPIRISAVQRISMSKTQATKHHSGFNYRWEPISVY